MAQSHRRPFLFPHYLVRNCHSDVVVVVVVLAAVAAAEAVVGAGAVVAAVAVIVVVAIAAVVVAVVEFDFDFGTGTVEGVVELDIGYLAVVGTVNAAAGRPAV